MKVVKNCSLCGKKTEELVKTKYNGKEIKICRTCRTNFEKLSDKGNIEGICEAINYFEKLMSENLE